MDSDMSARASSSRPPSWPAMAETVFLSIALFTAFSGSAVRTAASVGVKRVSCVCMVSIIILYMEIIYYNGGKIKGRSARTTPFAAAPVVALEKR
jgi:hypothetical protein